jgi:hypothetical protein
VLRLPRAGWEWVSTPYTKLSVITWLPTLGVLAPGSEDQLARVLRYQPPDEAKRYLALLQTARVHGIDDAYRDLH